MQCRATLRYEDACQQRDQETKQVELCRQQLQRVETRNDELTVLVSALRAEKDLLEQQPLANDDKVLQSCRSYVPKPSKFGRGLVLGDSQNDE